MLNKYQNFSFFILCYCLCSISCIASAKNLSTASPNIVFIYTDDQAPWALGASGNKQAITPNMDLLAKQGMSFLNAYTTTPVCSPSRAGLLTSRYGYELGINDWINTHWKSLTGLTPKLGLNPQLPTWPKMLQQAGYYTGLIGKWHLGIEDNYHPTLFGYNEFSGFREGGVKTLDPKLEVAGAIRQYKGLTADVLTDFALAFLSKHKDKPFALSLHYRAPHTNWLPVAQADSAPYENYTFTVPNPDYPNLDVKRVQQMMKDYLSSVRSVDRNLGRVLAKLTELQLNKNTVVIFTSDHGYNMGHNGIWHKGNGHWLLKTTKKGQGNIPDDQRPNMYDNSIKVPVIVRWPSVVAANSHNLSTVSNLDWFPTLLAIAGAEQYLPQNTLIRGRNFLSLLTGEKQLISSDYYAAYTTEHQSITAMRMYSDGRYKLIKDFRNKGRDEFYHLTDDPAESLNLFYSKSTTIQAKIVEFTDRMKEKMVETQDPFYVVISD